MKKPKTYVPRYAKNALIALFLAAALFLYLHIGAHISVRIADITYHSASEMQDTFDQIREAIRQGDIDTSYTQYVSEDASEYVFAVYTAVAANYGLIPAEWTLLGVQYDSDDIALLTGDPKDIAPFSSDSISCILLTTREAAEKSRLAWADYYVWGRAFSAAAE
ncbi:MAG: hypothetical protein ACOYI8_02680 [Christensenellales bacterium]|jgi:hypothetical protein